MPLDVRISTVAVCLLFAPAVCAAQDLSGIIASARGADVVILGEIHDNPGHHRNQAEIVAALQPAGLVFEMVPQSVEDEVNALREEGAGPDQIARSLDWERTGWPDFTFYAEILEAAPEARVFGAEQSRADVRRAALEGAAAVFGPDATTYGLDEPLPRDEQEAREAQLLDAHCGQLSPEVLPGMVEAQRLRDAGLADAVLWARTMSADAQVVVIAGSAHAERSRGVPSLLDVAAPDVKVVSVGQFESAPEDAAEFDEILISPAPSRGDPCAGLTEEEP